MAHNERVSSVPPSSSETPSETPSESPSESPRPSRYLLVLPDREVAEEVARVSNSRYPMDGPPQIVREALAGEDDAEDAQWLVVMEDPDGILDLAELRALAEEHEGWVEAD